MRGIIVDRIVRHAVAIVGVLVGPLVLAQSPVEAASRASLSFPCGYTQRMVRRTLSGHYFYARERVRIVYTVFASPAPGAKAVGTYRRMMVTDAQGNDSIAIRSLVHLTLGYDHRVIDGAVADQFMMVVKKTLENWSEDVG